MDAFKNCSKIEYETVMREIEILKEEMAENLECIGFCNSLQNYILEENKEKLIKKWTTFEVSRVLHTII